MEAAAVPADVAERAPSAVVAALDITRRYGEGDTAVDALRGVSIDVEQGKLTAVMGPSGSGKSTLMHILAALDRPTDGSVWIAGTKLGELNDTEITKLRREHIGFVFQFFNLLPMLTAEENVLLPLTIAGEKPDPAWREELLKTVGLDDRRSHRPAELSGGQQQRVAIARALISKPTVVFADEPTGNLDSKTGGEILELLRHSVAEMGQTTVMVTHDPRAAAIADRILFLADGLIVREMPRSEPSDVLTAMEELSASLMLTVALKGLAGRKVRASLTAIAIVLGVAMISGTYVLTDTINNGFSTIFTQSYANADVVITGKAAFDSANGNSVEPPPMPESLLAKVKKLPGTAVAAGAVSSNNVKLIGKNGKVISSGGAPTLGFSVTPAGQIFNPTKLTAGRWPRGSNEVAVDKGTASSQGFNVGDPIKVQGFGPIQRMRITGIATFPGVSIGGATFAIFDQPTAQALFNKPGQLDAIRVKSKSGVSPQEMISQIQPLLSPTQVVRSGTAQAKKDQHDQVSGFLSFLRYALLAFAGIALFVGAFVIANTLSITIAQRTREFATLRTLGASRRQVLWSVVIEAFVIGLFGSVVGLFLGLALAKGLNWLFVQIGIDLPTGSTVFATRTVVVCLLVGTVVTLVASIRPARRATRVPPIAAVREGSVIPPSRWAKYGAVTSLVILVIAIVMVSLGALANGIATAPRLLLLGVGVLVLFIGVSMNAPKVVRPLAAVLGAPAQTIGGAPGILARDNATRNPGRTASTASALMIGLALVTFVAIFGAGIRSSFEDAVNKLFVGDYALTSTSTFNPIDAQAGNALVGKPGVEDVSAIRAGSARYLGANNDLTGVQPNLNKTVSMVWTQGSNAVPGELGLDGFFASKNYVKDHHLSLGSPVTLQFPSGKKTTVKLRGVWDEPKGGSPFAHITISTALFDKFTPRPQDEMVLMNTPPEGVSDANTARLNRYVAGFADAKIQTRNEFKSNFEAPINKLLNLLYALLALSVIVSLVGIVNTLVLTVFERTRELGMLRAVGMTRRQVRMMIRYESIVTSLMGATLGMVVGIFLAALITHALSSSGIVFAVPWIQIVYFVLAAIIVGILAAVIPARRAARLNVLQALQYE